jgi:hypothetical protein
MRFTTGFAAGRSPYQLTVSGRAGVVSIVACGIAATGPNLVATETPETPSIALLEDDEFKLDLAPAPAHADVTPEKA